MNRGYSSRVVRNRNTPIISVPQVKSEKEIGEKKINKKLHQRPKPHPLKCICIFIYLFVFFMQQLVDMFLLRQIEYIIVSVG
jgi:hypothetical protein